MADEKQTVPSSTPVAQVSAATSDFHLVVVHPFGEYSRGDVISDLAAVNDVLAGENRHHVHKTIPR